MAVLSAESVNDLSIYKQEKQLLISTSLDGVALSTEAYYLVSRLKTIVIAVAK